MLGFWLLAGRLAKSAGIATARAASLQLESQDPDSGAWSTPALWLR